MFDLALQMLAGGNHAGGNHAGAIEILEQLRGSGKETAEVMRSLAEAHLGSGNLDIARRCCEKAIAIDPSCLRAIFLSGVIAANCGDVDSSFEALERSIALKPDYLDATSQAG